MTMISNRPELRSECRACRPVGQLGSNALEEEPGEAVAVDRRNARWREPPDQAEPDYI